MKPIKPALRLCGLVLLCCTAMALVEIFLQPTYVWKSLCKIVLFFGGMLFYGVKPLEPLHAKNKREVAVALALGLGTYGLLLGGYFLLQHQIDLAQIAQSLLNKEGIAPSSFLWVALYISLVNSLLEELFFRGFAYLQLCRSLPPRLASLFSAGVFSLYHVSILSGWFSPWMFALILTGLMAAGLLFNYLDRRGGILPSWLVHLCANLAINTIGMMMFHLI